MLRKGQCFERKSDGFVFRVERTGHRGTGAFLQCVDAERIYGWYWEKEIEQGFKPAKETT